MTQNQNNIRSVEEAVRVLTEQPNPKTKSEATRIIISLLTHLKEQIEKEEMAVPADEYDSAALAPEVKSAPFDRGFDYGRSFTKKEDIALIDSLIHPTQ